MNKQIPQNIQQTTPCLLFFDIDGTILDESTGCVSENTINAIQQAQANGHLVFINSGRTFCNIDPAIQEIGFDGYVCGCGTHILYQGQVLLYHSVDKDLTLEIMEDIRQCGLEAILEGKDGIYFDDEVRVPEWNHMKNRLLNTIKSPLGSWNDTNLSIDKFCTWSDKDSNFNGFFNKYKDRFEFIDRGDNIHEVVPIGFSKATGIQFLMKQLTIPFENTFGFGDSTNDLPMLEYANNSIAMGNCTPCLRDIVSFVTKNVEEDGIEYALKHFQLI